MDLKSLVPWRSRSQTPVTRDGSFDPFVSFRREVDRMFDDFFNSFGSTALRPAGGWDVITPAVDLNETDNEVLVTAELPGVSEKEVEVSLAGDVLTIKGEKKYEHEEKNGMNGYYAERRYGSFSRSIALPFEVRDEKIDASYDKGVLTVRIPKKPEAQPRRIAIGNGAQTKAKA